MTTEKWNCKTHKYETVQIADGAKIYSDDENEIIQCASCAKSMTYSKSYTSLLIHNSVGFGYMVCEECHEKEIEQRLSEKECW